ncbi:cytochrome c [Falsirhodobacter sp. alg1]|uniref:cytochrome c n=1 Tax=Falsirhodobacter sp. alg1 TaxID=1472418 RepID=UPI000786EA97|nr:cytochrome c [Falsirhodobacter sp. alg1]
MKTFLRIVAGLVVLGVVALLAFIFVPVQTTKPTEDLADDWKPAEGQGEYVMYASDCAACHTGKDGDFAGGVAIDSPMGAIWASNITPDKETGIGNWTLDQFRAALYDGIDDEGAHLYPAMPYENFRKLSEQDVRALYDYFMNDVAPVHNEVQKTELSFPFNLRFGIRAWNWLALTGDAGFDPTQAADIQNRGQYLVEGPGHCAACHSPRTAFMTQDGTTAGDKNFLAGGEIDGWLAPTLRGEDSAPQKWSVEDTATYLATGRNNHSTANGEMGLVVEHSLQHLTDQDNLAIAAFLKGIDGADVTVPEDFASLADAPLALEEDAPDAVPTETEKMLSEATDLSEGARLYLDNCSACHFVTGNGAPQIFPSLAGNTLVTADQTEPLISIILHGADVPSTQKRPMHLVMQGYADRLSDQEIAELASFVRSGWGNDAAPVTAADVKAVRDAD